MRAAIIGATKGMGRQLARRMAERGDMIAILGRSEASLQAATTDLQIRGAAEVHPIVFDLADADGHRKGLRAIEGALGHIDAIIITAGGFDTQEGLESDLERTARILDLNYTKTVLFCEHARKSLMDQQGGGKLVVFTSVAGDKGRKTVGLYGSSKAGLSHYLDSLDARYRDAGLVTINVKPGFIRTSMTAGLPEPPFAGEPDQVAVDVLKAMEKQLPTVYTPSIWALVMLVIKHLPKFVMRKVGF